MDFEAWFRAEVIADRLYGADEDAARHTWNAVLGQAISACESEQLSDPTDNPDDIAYGHAVRDCIAAIQRLKGIDAARLAGKEGA